jgi:hypothetical protein
VMMCGKCNPYGKVGVDNWSRSHGWFLAHLLQESPIIENFENNLKLISKDGDGDVKNTL